MILKFIDCISCEGEIHDTFETVVMRSAYLPGISLYYKLLQKSRLIDLQIRTMTGAFKTKVLEIHIYRKSLGQINEPFTSVEKGRCV